MTIVHASSESMIINWPWLFASSPFILLHCCLNVALATRTNLCVLKLWQIPQSYVYAAEILLSFLPSNTLFFYRLKYQMTWRWNVCSQNALWSGVSRGERWLLNVVENSINVFQVKACFTFSLMVCRCYLYKQEGSLIAELLKCWGWVSNRQVRRVHRCAFDEVSPGRPPLLFTTRIQTTAQIKAHLTLITVEDLRFFLFFCCCFLLFFFLPWDSFFVWNCTGKKWALLYWMWILKVF